MNNKNVVYDLDLIHLSLMKNSVSNFPDFEGYFG